MSNHTYITYSEIIGHKPNENELANLIASLNKEAAFRFLAMINNFLALFPINFDEAKYVDIQSFLAFNLLDTELFEKVNTFVKDISLVERPIFHRQQILILMKRILLESSNKGEINPDNSREAKNTIGKLCLMISDFTVSAEQEKRTESDNPLADEESKRILSELLTQMLPVIELVNPPELSAAVVRTQEYIHLFNKHFSEIFDGKSLSPFFESLTGITLERFLQMTIGVYASLIKELNEFIDNPANFNIRKSTFFSNLNYSKDEIAGFYKLTTIKFEELNLELENNPLRTQLQPQYDFIVFRKYPIFYLSEDILTCVDASFLVEKVSIGLYHTILNSFIDNKVRPEPFFQCWGYVFEKYVNNIFREIYPLSVLSNRFHPNTFFDTKTERECFDGVVEYPNSLIVMEYKGGLLNTKAKYSGDVNSLLNEMSKKYGNSEKDAAIKQLSTKIELLFHSNYENRLRIRDLEFPNVVNVYPVVIVNEISLAFGLAHWRLKGWFEEEMKTKSVENSIFVKPLMVLTVEDLEMLSPYLEAEDFTLLEFIQFYSDLEYIRFSWFLIREHWYEPTTSIKEVFYKFREYREIAFRRNQKIQDRFDNFMNEIMALFKTDRIN